MTPIERITVQKIFLARQRKYPFFGYLLFNLQFVESEECPTMGVDGTYCYYNSDFVSKLNNEELRGVLIHEILHIAKGDLWRRDSREPQRWNISADILCNNIINGLNDSDIKLPNGAIYDAKHKDSFTEKVYDDIKDRVKYFNIGVEFSNGKDGKGCRGFHGKWGEGLSKKQKKELSEKWKRAVKIAADIHQKQRGDLPAGLQRLVENTETVIDWREVLLSYLTTSKNDYSFCRPDKRLMYSDLIFPDLQDEDNIENIVVGLDTSGSMETSELSKFLGEVNGLIKSFSNTKAWFCSVDSEVYDFKEINKYELPETIRGGGGTNYGCLFEEIKKRNLHPSVVIMLGDGWAEYPSEIPDYDVIWLFTKNHGNPPNWGRKIIYNC